MYDYSIVWVVVITITLVMLPFIFFRVPKCERTNLHSCSCGSSDFIVISDYWSRCTRCL